MEKMIPLSLHAEICQSIYAEFKDESRLLSILAGRQGERGHRYYQERCVWCGVNYLDEILYQADSGKECVGPDELWSDEWWPLAKIDAVLRESRGYS